MLPGRCCYTALWPIRLAVSNDCPITVVCRYGTVALRGRTVTP